MCYPPTFIETRRKTRKQDDDHYFSIFARQYSCRFVHLRILHNSRQFCSFENTFFSPSSSSFRIPSLRIYFSRKKRIFFRHQTHTHARREKERRMTITTKLAATCLSMHTRFFFFFFFILITLFSQPVNLDLRFRFE